MDNLVEIADDERSGGSSSSELPSSPGTSLPELEDQENVPPINYETLNAIAIPILPPASYAARLIAGRFDGSQSSNQRVWTAQF